jgi:hypothetical protein
MYNVGCLDSNEFNQIANGSKTNVLLRYQQPDPQLESVVPGEPILFLETHSDRALISRVISIRQIEVKRNERKEFLILAIRVSNNRHLITFPMLHRLASAPASLGTRPILLSPRTARPNPLGDPPALPG